MASDKSEISNPASPAEPMDHPYLTFLHKRARSHRKKLEKIRALELKDPKQLNAQQLELVGTKAALEKLLVELETLREQFVQLQEQEQQTRDERLKAKDEELNRLKLELAAAMEKETEQEPQQRDPFSDVHELLKALHVVNLHQALGKDVPMVLDFFEKVLRGNTRPPAELSYEENLAESMEEARKYLTGSDKEFACDTTYVGLRAFVDELAAGKREKVETEQEEAEEETPVIPAISDPQINFFTESQLEQDDISPAEQEVETVESEEPLGDVEETTQEAGDVAPEEDATATEEQAEAPPAPEAIPSPPLSFAVVAATGLPAERTASAPSEAAQPKEMGSEESSPRGKNNQRRRQGRWREKGSNSSGNKSGNGSPTNGGKPRRPRGPRAENADALGGKAKEGRRPRVDRALRKQGTNAQPAAPMLAPHA